MNEKFKAWYERNSPEIKLIHSLLSHLKKNGHTIETRNQKPKDDKPKVKKTRVLNKENHWVVQDAPVYSTEYGEFNVEFK